MKTFAVIAVAAAAAVNTVDAFWDNGHMLVGEIASQLLTSPDRSTIQYVLNKWEDDFPNTNTTATAAIWPDLIKCSKMSASCTTPVLPSFTQMEKWHFVNLPLNVNGTKWGGQEPDLTLFALSFGGEAVDVLEKSMTTFATTKSNWAANLVLRNLIHIVGDLHQPLHVVAAVSKTNPAGDQGGNLYKFTTPCANANLHALWDASGGEYLNNWSPNTSAIQSALTANATALLEALPANADTLNFEDYKNLSYSDFVSNVTGKSLFRHMILESYKLSTAEVYPRLNLTYNAEGFVACPSQEYFDFAKTTMKTRIAIAGKRLSVVLTQLARQLRVLGLAN
ncbi:hypothetical protein FI667_g6036, partial [Globisporangium splendens]